MSQPCLNAGTCIDLSAMSHTSSQGFFNGYSDWNQANSLGNGDVDRKRGMAVAARMRHVVEQGSKKKRGFISSAISFGRGYVCRCLEGYNGLNCEGKISFLRSGITEA